MKRVLVLVSAITALAACQRLNPAFDGEDEGTSSESGDGDGDGDGSGDGDGDGDGAGDGDGDGDGAGDGDGDGDGAGDGDGDGDGDELCDPGEACAMPLPPPWAGPIAIAEGAFAPPPGCGDQLEHLGTYHMGIVDVPLGCSECSCGELQGTCPPAQLGIWANSGICEGDPNEAFQVPDAECASLENDLAGESIGLLPQQLLQGSCLAIGGDVVEAVPPGFEYSVALCHGLEQSDLCGGEGNLDGVCTELPGQPFAPMLCAFASGDLPCPLGWEDYGYTLYEGYDDTRECSECGCTVPDDPQCQYVVSAYGNGDCAEVPEVLTTGFEEACSADVPNGDVIGSYKAVTEGVAPDTCAPIGGEPEGAVVGKNPVTVCCHVPG